MAEFKEKGNRLYADGDYQGAEELFSQAILKNPRDPTFFTNRAITRLKLEKWAEAEHDARAAIDLYGLKDPRSLKSCNYLAQALLGLQRPQEAYDVAIDAYRASLAATATATAAAAAAAAAGAPKSHVQTEALSRLVLRAKQQIWAARETARLREMDDTLGAVEQLVEADLARALAELDGRRRDGQIGEVGFAEDQKALREDAERKIARLREAFSLASNGEIRERVVPDYLVDGITFEIMHDPVVTPSGASFDRIGIVKYVEQAGLDPVTRTPMTVADLRPNYALKAACDDFLDHNGWAVDW